MKVVKGKGGKKKSGDAMGGDARSVGCHGCWKDFFE